MIKHVKLKLLLISNVHEIERAILNIHICSMLTDKNRAFILSLQQNT